MDEKDYKELDFIGYGMDKDDWLDKFLPYDVLNENSSGDYITITLGAEEPDVLQTEEAVEFARDKASFKFQAACILKETKPIETEEQTQSPKKDFIFKKEM